MTLDEAIRIKQSPKYGTTWPVPPREREADRLSIEALEAIKHLREGRVIFDTHKLPSETEE